MMWHYEKNGAAFGPVSEEQLETAKAKGEIDVLTRVFCEGWSAWKIAGEVWPSMRGPLPAIPAHLLAPSSPADTNGGPWRDRKALVTQKGVSLGHACLKCGEPATTRLPRTLSWHHPALYLLILVGVIVYLIVGMALRQTARAEIPLCAACDGRRKRNIGIGWFIFLSSVALVILGGSNVDENEALGWPALISGMILMIFSLVWAVGVQIITVQRMQGNVVWICKAHPKLLETLPEWRGRVG
jgi:hypothetical protein